MLTMAHVHSTVCDDNAKIRKFGDQNREASRGNRVLRRRENRQNRENHVKNTAKAICAAWK